MNKIILHTHIKAPIERCFDLSTSIDLHKISAAATKEEAISGVTSGLIKLNETVTWRAKHFGLWHKLETKITEYQKPNLFVDEMVKGSFGFMKHTHEFYSKADGTLMSCTFEFASPLGILGRAVDSLFLRSHMENFLIERNKTIKEFAETDKWKEVL